MLFANNFDKLKQNISIDVLWLILCSGLVFGIIWTLVVALFSSATPLETRPSSSSALIPSPVDTAVLMNAPFFGKYLSSVIDISESQLEEGVVGILFAENPDASQVILRSEDGFDKMYRIGESVRAGVMIQSIDLNEIVISNHGKLERLAMPEQKLTSESPPPPLPLED